MGFAVVSQNGPRRQPRTSDAPALCVARAGQGELPLNASFTVLIIDRASESRDVLQTLLERNGTRAIGVGETAEALRAAETDPPDLIVIDLDSGLDRPEATCQQGTVY